MQRLTRSVVRKGLFFAASSNRRHASRFSIADWVGKNLLPQEREPQAPETIEAAKLEAQTRGNTSLFDKELPKSTQRRPREPASPTTVSRKKYSVKLPSGRVVTTLSIFKKRKVVALAQHQRKTGPVLTSVRKLNLLSRQVAGKPIDHAILQMQFSEKKASQKIYDLLVKAKQAALEKQKLDPSKMVVAESWVTKGNKHEKTPNQPDIKGRGRTGIITHKVSKMWVRIREGKTLEERRAEDRARKLKRIVSAHIVREDVPIRNPRPMWQW